MKKSLETFTKSVKLYFALLIISTALILYGTLFPIEYDVPKTISGLDKVVHFVMFGAWTLFFGLVRFLKQKYSLLPVFLISAFFGIFIEVMQHILPTGRTAELMDAVADISGTGAAILVLYIISKKVPMFSPSPS